MRRVVCAYVLWLTTSCVCLPAAFGQGKDASPTNFATPEEASNALAVAYQKGDSKAVAEVLGDKARRLVFSGDPVIDRHGRICPEVYVYKILAAQGPLASGGAREYIVNGRMTEGFTRVAFPVRYRVSGIMTFLVNQVGVAYQKDLGPKTSRWDGQ